MECKLDTQHISPEDRGISILYATHEYIVYQEKNGIVLASCDGSRLSETTVPVDYLHYRVVDLNDALLFVFSGTELLLLDKSGMEPMRHKLNPVTVGRCISQLHACPEDNHIVMGTKQMNRIQFVNYNFLREERVAQTASWNAASISDTFLSGTTLYAVLDKSSIIAIDIDTGETLWTRFETAEVASGLALFDKYFVYACQGMIKLVDENKVKTVRIPLQNVTSILHATDRELILTANDHKNVLCYNLVHDKMKWEIFGNDKITNAVKLGSTTNEDLLAVQTDKYVSVINTSAGTAEYNIKTNNIARLRKTGDHLLIQKTTGTCTLVPGVTNVESD